MQPGDARGDTPQLGDARGDTPQPGDARGDTPQPGDVRADTPLDALAAVQRRVLWLAVRIVDYANRERPKPDGLKVGGHQASSASMVSIMTALWFAHLDARDRVAVKPHAAPVLHAIHYLLGHLERRHLTTLRSFGGLQAYPSRSKDPFPVDFSTGSVGHGAVGPLFAAAVRRYVEAHFGPRPPSRFIALIGDAELDEGNVWEAVAEPATAGLGTVLWVVDLNRQSLDRVVPGARVDTWRRMFEASGWHVTEVRHGARLRELFSRPGGELLRRRLERMPNEEYQSLLVAGADQARDRLLAGADAALKRLLADHSDAEVAALVRDLGGHDLEALLEAYRAADAVTDRPSVVFAHTIKGWGLPVAGEPLNHAALLTAEQIDALRADLGVAPDQEWEGCPPGTPEAALCADAAARLRRPPPQPPPPASVPPQLGVTARKPVSTQEVLGRLLGQLSREEHLAPHVVTVAPDVATSTNLAGWINRAGVFAPREAPDWFGDTGPLRWREHPRGQHIELGISEMNLFALLGQLGLADELHDARLLPIGTVYDPFVCRGLDALVYALYSRARFVLAGTPSGITLSPEGGAHQSTVTPGLGVELPGVVFAEPAYATELDWLLCDGLARLSDEHAPSSTYLRLSTRPIDQEPFERLRASVGDERLRADVLAGAYLLAGPDGAMPDVHAAPDAAPAVVLAASGAVLPEVLQAARTLRDEGVAAAVLAVTSLDRLYRDWRATLRRGVREARDPGSASHLARVLGPGLQRAPIVTVHDAASHAMAWLGSALGTVTVPLGVDAFGQSGTIPDLYGAYDLDAPSVVNAALLALRRSR